MNTEYRGTPSWRSKFGHAFRGAKKGIRGESSFFVHFFATALVVAAAVALRVTRTEWCMLLLCVTIVLSAEMVNTSFERLARALEKQHNEDLGEALDVASAAVLIASLGSAAVGLVIFVYRLGANMDWW